MITEIKNKAKILLKQNDKTNYAIYIAILCLILLIIIPNGDESDTVIETEKTITTMEYTEDLEHKLTQLISSIDGVGETTVMVTLEGGIEYIYATEEKYSTDLTEDTNGEVYTRIQQSDNTEESYILIEDENGEEKGLIQKQVEPAIKGVVVVCEGGDDVVIQHRITEVVTTALNLSSTKVYVVK